LQLEGEPEGQLERKEVRMLELVAIRGVRIPSTERARFPEPW
jgi:hypothetical protein